MYVFIRYCIVHNVALEWHIFIHAWDNIGDDIKVFLSFVIQHRLDWQSQLRLTRIDWG